MEQRSQWEKMRDILNAHRRGQVTTDATIVEISAILDVIPTGGLRARHAELSSKPDIPFSSDEMYLADAEGYSVIAPTGDSRDRSGVSDEEANRRASAFADRLAKTDIAPTGREGDESDEEVRSVSKYPTWREMVKANNAGALVDEWQRYAYNRKTAFADQLLSMEDFRLYLTYWYGTDILA